MSNADRPLIYAHRGASADHPENTIPAFAGAAEQGADWVELDVHLAADGALVVHHDGTYADGRDIDAWPPETIARPTCRCSMRRSTPARACR